MNYIMSDGKKIEISEETVNNFRKLSKYSGGDGSKENPYQIYNLKDLQKLSVSKEDWSSCFIQISDIDAKETKEWNGGKGFFPIGDNITNFKGDYDGQGHVISNLYIRRVVDFHIGLFGYIKNATICNIGLTNVVNIGYDYVGGLVGYSVESIIRNISIIGKVSGGSYVGGLVGYNSCYSLIEGCRSSGNIDGGGFGSKYIGGLVGLSTTNSTITDSFSEGKVLHHKKKEK